MNVKACLWCGVLIASVLNITAFGAGDEVRSQLDQLRALRRFDEAIDYLESLKDSPRVSGEFKQAIDFEIGVTLIQAAGDERDSMRRESQLDQALDLLRKFLKQHPEHESAIAARDQVGNVFVERARMKLERSKSSGIDEVVKERLQDEARELFEEASATYSAALTVARAELERIGPLVDPADRELLMRRDGLRGHYLGTQLLLPAIGEELADTFATDSEQRKTHLLKAAEQYSEVYETHRTRIAGLYGHLYQGRCYVKLGRHKEALQVFDNLFAYPDHPDVFRQLKLKAVTLACESWLHDSQQKYEEAIQTLEQMLATAHQGEKSAPEWLFVRLSLARAHKLAAFRMRKNTPHHPQVAKSVTEAVKHATIVAHHVSEQSAAARQLLAELEAAAKPPASEQANTFEEARRLGKQTFEEWQLAEFAAKELTSQIGQTVDANKRAELRRQLETAQAQIASALLQAEWHLRRALELADNTVPAEDVVVVRYFLCYVLYTKESYQDAATVGKALTRKHPDAVGAVQGAKIAFASYIHLFNQSETDHDRNVALAHVREFGRYILKQWPDQPIAREVEQTLGQIEKNKPIGPSGENSGAAP